MFRECKTCGKEIHSDAKICPHCNTLRFIGLKLDHIIILIVVIVLSITILNTYAIESGYQKASTGHAPSSNTQMVHLENH